MKKQRKKDQSLHERFLSSCASCGKAIGPDQEVFAASAKIRPGLDLSGHAGTVVEMLLLQGNRTVLAAVASDDSQAKREGKDLLFMCCSTRCSQELTTALQSEIDLGEQLGLGNLPETD